MSAHNHDEEIIKRFGTKTAKALQQKADDLKDEKVKNALIKADISGLSRDEARAKLKNIVDEILSE